MIKELRSSFFQTSFITTVWLVLLVSIFNQNYLLDATAVWRLLLIGIIFGLVFGVLAPYLWDYATFSVTKNVLISTLANVLCGLTSIYLFSSEMFSFIIPWTPIILMLTLIGHILGFYFYSKLENKKISLELNEKLK